MMRITDLYDLKNRATVRTIIKNNLMEDIISLAEAKFGEQGEFTKFFIRIKLEEINPIYK